MRDSSTKKMLMLGTAVAIVMTARPAAAQVAPADPANQKANQNEIIITANRRPETLQHVPAAVTVISQAQIEARGIDSFDDFARSVPGLTMSEEVKNRAAFDIRGITTAVTGGGNAQDPVSVYINDTPITDTYGAIVQPDLHLFDVARIEVLRGPQGTLFGSGSLGGTVRIITNSPDASKFETAGRVDIGTTEHGGTRQRYDAMINVPIVDNKLALRLVGYYRNEGGWVKNTTLGTRNDTKDWGGRAALQWTPTDAVKVKLEVFHQKSDPEDGDAWNPSLGKFKSSSPIPLDRPSNITNYNLAIDYVINNFATLTSSSTYQKSNSALFEDIGSLLGPGTPAFVVDANPWNSRFYVQETRLVSNTKSRLQWVLGEFYINRKTSVPNYDITAPGLNALFHGLLGSDNYFTSSIFTKSTELAGYADGSYEILDGLKLRGGIRVFHTTADYNEQNRVVLNFATFRYNPPLSFVSRSSETNTTWRTGISYEPRKNLLVYANISKGFRVGQVNPNFGPSPVNPSDYVIPEGYKPDSTINYEVGTKMSGLDGAFTLNLAAFYIDWKNIQINAGRISDHAAFIANAGRATAKGAELEFTARPVRGVSFYGNATLQSGKIDSVPTDIVVPAAIGDRLPGLAHWKIAGGGEYRWHVGSRNQAYIRVDAQYTSSSPNAFSDAGLNRLYATDEAFTRIDASIGLDTAWGNVAVYGENLANNDAIILKDLSLANGFTTLRPRTFGIRLTYRH